MAAAACCCLIGTASHQSISCCCCCTAAAVSPAHPACCLLRRPPRRRNLASAFRTAVINARETDAASLAPVRQLGEASLVYLRASNVYLLAVTKRNSNAMMIMQFLSRVRGQRWGWVYGR